MKPMRRFATLMLAITGVGCATAVNREGLEQRLKRDQNYEVVVHSPGNQRNISAGDIRSALSLRPQLPSPFRLAVYLPDKIESGDYESGIRLNHAARNHVGDWQKRLRRQGIASEVFPLSPLTVEKSDVPSLRLAAARHGADAVLIVRGEADISRYWNPLAVLYLSLVGLWIVPGSHAEAIVLLDAAVFDVGNGYLYLSVRAAGEEERMSPSALMRPEKVMERAALRALDQLGDELVEQASTLR